VERSKTEDDWTNRALFTLASLGDVALFHYWLSKGLDLDAQDEDGDSALHYAARRGHIPLITYLLKRQAVISLNKKGRTALLEAYTFKKSDAVREIIKFIIQKNSIKNILQDQTHRKLDAREQQRINQLISDCIKHIKKSYLNRCILSRLLAKHNERAMALIAALRYCRSVKEVRELINNQCNLFKGLPTKQISGGLLAQRWSAEIRNKPRNVDKSSFYKTLKTLPVERLSKVVIKSYPPERISHRQL
jgi:tyrosyl-tRNA synthetase